MRTKLYIKIIFRVLLTCVFFIGFIRGVHKLIKKEVGSRSFTETISSNSFPSVAICAYMYAPKIDQVYMLQNRTFDDVMKLPSIRDHVFVDLEVSKAYQRE